ncbi:hypothetical protein HMPREF1548_03060 [Clostridium sp. KLE 1755]|nr:hypothetical protein HMPREF1548_03060 [Clostridium sp. KLE 1755]
MFPAEAVNRDRKTDGYLPSCPIGPLSAGNVRRQTHKKTP